MLVQVVAVQARVGEPLSLEEKIHIFKQRPDFVCLPEYQLLSARVTDYHRAALEREAHFEYYRTLSDQLSTCIIGGTVVDADSHGLYNTCYVFNRGLAIGKYCKRNPMPGEIRGGIRPGTQKLVVEIDRVRIAVLICGDVLRPELFSELVDDRVDIIFIPTVSPYRPDDSRSQKLFRDQRYFLDGARRAGAFVVKVCGVGRVFNKPLQGRSLVASPWDFKARTDVRMETERQVLSVTLDIAELREFRDCLRQRPQSHDRAGNLLTG